MCRCKEKAGAAGALLLDRVDLAPLHALHTEQGRKFPLLIAQLLANLLEGLRRESKPSDAWKQAMSLCYAELPPQLAGQVEAERLLLLGAFEDAGITTSKTLEMLLPYERYTRLLGAAQLNAFGITTTRGLEVSALLDSGAPFFNHSCDPSVLIAPTTDHHVKFVAGCDCSEGDELTISYLEVDRSSCVDRQELLMSKYGFACTTCPEFSAPTHV